MDQRKPKRPRSSTPTKMSGSDLSPPPPQKKKSKGSKSKQKKTKRNRSSSITGGGAAAAAAAGSNSGTLATAASSMETTSLLKPPKNMESTATADGRIMAQMLSTFSKLEQSRFEAFQRASFPADAIEKWIAACLSHRFRIVDHHHTTSTTANNNNNNINITSRSLSDLVAVGQEGEICMVVGVLAKIYAQRLVQTAIRQRAASASATAAATASQPSAVAAVPQQPQQQQQALLPSDILKAHEERRRLGLDPGFFLQAAQERQGLWQSDNATSSSLSSSNSMYQQRRLAALQAQDEYDAHIKAMNEEHMAKQQQQQHDENKQGDNKGDDDNETLNKRTVSNKNDNDDDGMVIE